MTDKEKCEQVKPKDLQFQCDEYKCAAHESYRLGWSAALRESVVVKELVEAAKHYSKYLTEEEGHTNTALHRALENYAREVGK